MFRITDVSEAARVQGKHKDERRAGRQANRDNNRRPQNRGIATGCKDVPHLHSATPVHIEFTIFAIALVLCLVGFAPSTLFTLCRDRCLAASVSNVSLLAFAGVQDGSPNY